MPLRVCGYRCERDRTGKQFKRAAFGILDLRDGGEGEGRAITAEISDEFEVLQADGGRERIWCRQAFNSVRGSEKH